MKKQIKNIAKRLPYLQRLFRGIENLTLQISQLEREKEQLAVEVSKWKTENEQLAVEVSKWKTENEQLEAEVSKWKTWMPPGHYYSPIPSLDELREKEQDIFNRNIREIAAIDLNEAEQIHLFNKFKEYYKEQPFAAERQEKLRFFFENPNYSYSDAICLYSMIRYAQPKRIIEIGSGYSSCVTLDTNELFFANSISCTFIEPYPELLHSLIKEGDKERIEILPKKLQDIDLEVFSNLLAGDILFIDSTHVSKINSDVNYIFFEILPNIPSGVYIHFHDIFYPFEYPKEWIDEGRAWNEAYLLRAFLQYNKAFKICFFNTFLEQFYSDEFMQEMPLCMRNKGGSIWLKKCD